MTLGKYFILCIGSKKGVNPVKIIKKMEIESQTAKQFQDTLEHIEMKIDNPTKAQKAAAYVDGINEEIELLYKEVDFRVRNINIYYKEIMKL